LQVFSVLGRLGYHPEKLGLNLIHHFCQFAPARHDLRAGQLAIRYHELFEPSVNDDRPHGIDEIIGGTPVLRLGRIFFDRIQNLGRPDHNPRMMA
jgi:hypothetical protein